MFSENQCYLMFYEMAKVMPKFQEACIASDSSTRPVNLNKLIPNTFKMISTQAHP